MLQFDALQIAGRAMTERIADETKYAQLLRRNRTPQASVGCRMSARVLLKRCWDSRLSWSRRSSTWSWRRRGSRERRADRRTAQGECLALSESEVLLSSEACGAGAQ
jgi:hypothetical protein